LRSAPRQLTAEDAESAEKGSFIDLRVEYKVGKEMKTDFLSQIIEKKNQEVEQARKAIPESHLIAAAQAAVERRPFFARLATPGPLGANIIAEIKRASPSRGDIRTDLDPERLAKSYEKAGAAAISVLTERFFFRAKPDDLQTVRAVVKVPVLRKDFIISRYQLYETAAMGADAVLLIVRALAREMLQDLLVLCRELRLDALVEVHSEEELVAATRAGATLIGINNRDLTSFQTDLGTSVSLARQIKDGQVAVSESGIHDREQLERLMAAGIWNFLIGESLVRAPDPERHLRGLLGLQG
jgi:indole-3-glycerol phosphate synthase